MIMENRMNVTRQNSMLRKSVVSCQPAAAGILPLTVGCGMTLNRVRKPYNEKKDVMPTARAYFGLFAAVVKTIDLCKSCNWSTFGG